MKVYIYFKGSAMPDHTFTTLFAAKEYMESSRYTGIAVIAHDAGKPEIIWYDQGKRK